MWKRAAAVRSSAVDQNGKLWMAVRMRDAQKQPSLCTSSSNKFATYYRQRTSGRQVAKYDQKADTRQRSRPARNRLQSLDWM